MHQGHARIVPGSRRVGHGVNKFAGVVENIRAHVGKPLELNGAVGHVTQKNSDVVIGVRLLLAARASQTG